MKNQEVIVEDAGGLKASNGALVVDIGKKQRRKRIKQLRKGKGKLVDKIQQTISELRERKVIGENAQTVVLVVRQKSKSTFGGLF